MNHFQGNTNWDLHVKGTKKPTHVMGFDSHRLLYSLYFSSLLRVYKNNYSLNTYKFNLQSVEMAQNKDKWKNLQTHQIPLCPSTTESLVRRTLHWASQFWKTKANNNKPLTWGQTFHLELSSPARGCISVPCLVLACPRRLWWPSCSWELTCVVGLTLGKVSSSPLSFTALKMRNALLMCRGWALIHSSQL